MNWTWISIGFLFVLLNTYALWQKNRKLEGIAKPAAMVFLMIGLITFGFQLPNFPIRLVYFIVGTAFCLLGDVLLYFPPEKYFQAGLIAFLLGHVGYILGFGWIPEPRNQIIPILIFFIFLVFINSQIGQKLVYALRKGKRDRLVVPIIIYSITISVMVFLAGMRFFDTNWTIFSAYFVAMGALAFFVSDVLNAWVRFVRDFPYGRIVIMGLYHLGQYGIGIGVILHFAK